MNSRRVFVDVAITFSTLVAGCAPQHVPASESDGVTVRVFRACTDGSTTILHLQTDVTDGAWQFYSSRFSNPDEVFFETAINLLENGAQFSSTASSSRTPPTFDEIDETRRVDQEFVFPRSPSPGSEVSLDGTVIFSDLTEAIEVPGRFHIEFDVARCR